uniref:HIV Tat-specific factor 1 n=1 Tax=Kwoniella pini CBS 10737 TaxID=1296096 RepID=A0A1B9HZ42_9TREE|nr:HIV Tat-specific factor 1 [Kwoniella pini CBS 10737]OCF48501.1 HIV Tat-specific factor 1 [Kwoniella pini CBS 10737]
MPANAPIPGRFEEDPRVHFDKTAGKWQYEDDDGTEYEWTGQAWIPLIDEDLWKAQQAAYSVAGVDESTPANAVVARDEKRNKKRKKGEKDYTSNTLNTSNNINNNGSTSSTSGQQQQQQQTQATPKRTAVWVTNLPPNSTVDILASVFQKAGVLLIDDEGEPRIKLYYDEQGKFKGEALIMYFKEGSVDLAITLLDDTELELGSGYGNIKVKIAEYTPKDKEHPAPKDKDEKKDSSEHAYGRGEKKKLIAWHSDDDSDDPLAPAGGAPAPLSNRFNRVVVLKGMFTLEDLNKDPGLLLELKEEVREEAETLGTVTSVILYDKEEDGVMTVKFKDAVSAQACVLKMNNRYFDGRVIYAGIYTGKERFRKSGGISFGDDEEADKEERERLDNFAAWLVDGEEEGSIKQ